jgi:hypothetical protein
VPLLRRGRRSHQKNKRNNAKESGHDVTPADRDLQRVLMRSNRCRNAFRAPPSFRGIANGSALGPPDDRLRDEPEIPR